MSVPTPDPTDDPAPSRRRGPQISRLKKDNSELDLWDFDEAVPPATPARPETTPAPPSPGPPSARPEIPKEIQRAPRPLPAAKSDDSKAVRPSAQSSRRTNALDPLKKSKPADDIGELEENDPVWSDAERPSREPEPPANPPVPPAAPVPPVPDEAPEPPSGEPDESPTPPEARVDTRPIRERLGLTRLEKIGLGVLAAALAATAIFFLTTTLGRVPTKSDRAERPSYPIKGQHIRILEADSYWRQPVRTGPGAETVRRGTLLIPALTLELEGGPCAIRAFFRDDKGEFVGDGVTRSASSGKIEIAATAGLDDLGAHAAYRTGETKPWKIEIFEAPSVDSSRQEFRKLLELTISTDRR